MRKDNGFTLVELIIAVTIMAVLMAAAVVSYTETAKKSRDARRLSDIEVIRSALEICRSQDGEYPISISGSISCLTTNMTPLSKTPVDPQTGDEYTYDRGTDTSYTLSSTLENGDNCKDGTLVGESECQFVQP